MAVNLTTDERKLLETYNRVDPDGEDWVTVWASNMDHGLGFELATAVARRLCRRQLLEGNGDRGKWRGYAITEKGKKALQEASA